MTNERPPGVGDDWIELPCQVPTCPRMAWVPPECAQMADLRNDPPMIVVCSGECAIAMTDIMTENGEFS